MIQFDSVDLSFGGQCLFTDVSFTLQKKERCALVGRNGSGKSTLFRLIMGQLEADRGAISTPQGYRIGYLEQHIAFHEKTLLDEACLGLAENEKDLVYKAEKILFGLGFGVDDLHRAPSEFSGGYHLRIHLAKVLISEPDCLLLDEPTNYLDILSIRWLQKFLQRWHGEFILISHDREFMDSVSTHTMGLHRQGVKKIKGSTLDFFEQVVLEEEVHEKIRQKSDKKRAHLQSYIDRFGAKASKAAGAQSKAKMLGRIEVLEKLTHLANLDFTFKEKPFPGKKIASIHEVSFSYGDDPLIQNVSLDIEKGERIAIIGKNGRGKSTLLRLIAGGLTPKSGNVTLSPNCQIGYFGQTHIDTLDPKSTITEEILQVGGGISFPEAKSIAGLMMFSGDQSDKKISVLSGGEKSRVLLGKIIASPCNLLMLDEPTHHLDIESIEALIDAIETFSGSVIIVTHSELILRRLKLDTIILCDEQRQTPFKGTYDEFLEAFSWEESKGKKKKKASLNKEVRECEKLLAKLEKAKKNYSGNPNAQEAIELSQEIERLEERLYKLYENL